MTRSFPPLTLLTALLGVVAVALATALVVGPAEAARPVQRGSLKVTNTTVPAGGQIVLFGKIKKKAQRALKVQTMSGGRWVVVAKSRTNNRGRFSIGVETPDTPGTAVYRVLVPKYALVSSPKEAGARKFASTVTRTVTITLTSPAPAVAPTTGPTPTDPPGGLIPGLPPLLPPLIPGLPL